MTTHRSLLNRTKTGTHCFVYWENEDAGSIVDVGSVENKPVLAGIMSNVTIKGRKHQGKIAAVGSRDEMQRVDKLFLEDKFNPQNDDLPPLAETLAQPLNSELPKPKKKKASSKAPAASNEPAVSNEPAAKKAKTKKKGSIITVTPHGGVIHPSVETTSSGSTSTNTDTTSNSSTSVLLVAASTAIDATATVQTSVVTTAATETITGNTVTTAATRTITGNTITTAATSGNTVTTAATGTITDNTVTIAATDTITSHTVIPDTSSSDSDMSISTEKESDLGLRLESLELRMTVVEHQLKKFLSNYPQALVPPSSCYRTDSLNPFPVEPIHSSRDYGSQQIPLSSMHPMETVCSSSSFHTEVVSSTAYWTEQDLCGDFNTEPIPPTSQEPIPPTSQEPIPPTSLEPVPSSSDLQTEPIPPSSIYPMEPVTSTNVYPMRPLYPQHFYPIESTPALSGTFPVRPSSFHPFGSSNTNPLRETSPHFNQPFTSPIPSRLTRPAPSHLITPTNASATSSQQPFQLSVDCNGSIVHLIPVSSSGGNYLPSTSIVRSSLKPIELVKMETKTLLKDGKYSTVAQALARDAFFGKEVMSQCTPGGTPELKGLPRNEFNQLKIEMFKLLPMYHSCPLQFEPEWAKCVDSVGQACKRERKKLKQRQLARTL